MANESIPQRKCAVCGIFKPHHEFQRNRCYRFNISYYCKDCAPIRRRKDYTPRLKPCTRNICPLIGRECLQCGKSKSWEQFFLANKKTGQRKSRCKSCCSIYSRNRWKNSPRTKEQEDAHKAYMRRYQQEYKNTTKYKEQRDEHWLRYWNRPEIREREMYRRIRRTHGITREQLLSMVAKQENRCAICGKPPARKNHISMRLHVDHDHETGQVRALLCYTCNVGLGSFQDSPGLLIRAAEYLSAHKRPPIMK